MEKQVIIPMSEYNELIQYKEKTPCVLITHDYGPNYSSSRIDTIKITPLDKKSLKDLSLIVEQYKKDVDLRVDKMFNDFKINRQIENIGKCINSGKVDNLTVFFIGASIIFFATSIAELIYILYRH